VRATRPFAQHAPLIGITKGENVTSDRRSSREPVSHNTIDPRSRSHCDPCPRNGLKVRDEGVETARSVITRRQVSPWFDQADSQGLACRVRVVELRQTWKRCGGRRRRLPPGDIRDGGGSAVWGAPAPWQRRNLWDERSCRFTVGCAEEHRLRRESRNQEQLAAPGRHEDGDGEESRRTCTWQPLGLLTTVKPPALRERHDSLISCSTSRHFFCNSPRTTLEPKPRNPLRAFRRWAHQSLRC
jgi:hypothetical protein